MEAIALFFSKFSEELISLQLALVCFVSSLSIYWLLIRKKKKESAEWVSAALVRAYLDRVRAEERDIRLKLFGEDSAMVQAPKHGAAVMPPTGAHTVTTTLVTDPNMQKEMDALRAQLSMADQRSMEYDRLMNGLKAEKSELEKKLAAAAKGVAAGAGAGATAAEKVELEDLRAKLKEYEVIEDDLANLKKFKKENDDLKQQVEKLGGKVEASVQTTVSGSAQTKDETVTKIENVTEKITEPVTVISGASAKPAEDGVVVAGGTKPVEQAASAPAQAAPKLEVVPDPQGEESNTNVLQEIDPNAEATAAAAKTEQSGKSKEEELLSEFEKMLAS